MNRMKNRLGAQSLGIAEMSFLVYLFGSSVIYSLGCTKVFSVFINCDMFELDNL